MNKLSLIYLGNKLSRHGKNETGVEFSGKMLSLQHEVKAYSDKLNPLARTIDSIIQIIKHHKNTDFFILDVYSTANFYLSLTCTFFLKLTHSRYITALHGGDLPDRLKRSPRLSKYIFNSSYANISPSGYLKHSFEQAGIQTIQIPNNLPLKKYPFKKRTEAAPTLLYVRAFHTIYNPTLAIKVLHQLHKNQVKASLCMIGPDKDGSQQEVEDLIEKYQLQEYVTLKGKLTKEQWVELSPNYDIFINTTNVDNMPLSVIEAMCLGLGIVSTNPGGMPFLIQQDKTGLLVEVHNPQAMAEAIQSLLDSPEKFKELTQNAREVAQGFDTEAVLQKWNQVFEGKVP